MATKDQRAEVAAPPRPWSVIAWGLAYGLWIAWLALVAGRIIG